MFQNYVLLFLFWMILYIGVVIFFVWKLSNETGKPFWAILYYGSVAWQMDPRHKHIHTHPVSANNILSEVNIIQGLRLKLCVLGACLFAFIAIGLPYFGE